MTDVILNNLPLWTAAVKHKSAAGRGSRSKLELTGIKKLRELILELAVRGKLVPQDPNDEPASELVKRIAAEKAELIKAGKLKKQKPLPEITDEEKPFALPKGWEFERLANIAEINGGYAFKSSDYSDEGFRVIRISDFDENGLKFETVVRHSYGEKLSSFLIAPNSILMAMTGGTVGKSLLVKDLAEPMLVNQRVASIKAFGCLIPDFLDCVIKASMTQKIIHEAKNSTNDNISMADINNFIIPLMSLAEQKRIVAKVDELMALCDQLEQQTENQLSAHQQLVETLLATLTNTQSADELNANWARLAAHFDVLFAGPMGSWAVDRLKDTILQLAVQGKLVPQDPADEPASALLARIEAEKADLIKQGKLKKQKPLPLSEQEEIISVPNGWLSVLLGEVAVFQKGFAFKSSDYRNEGLMITKIQNLTENNTTNSVYIDEKMADEYSAYLLYKDDIVMTTVGSWFSAPNSAVGRTFLINDLFKKSLLNQNAVIIRLAGNINKRFIFYYLNSMIFKYYLEEVAQGTANQASITQESLKSFCFLMPPLEEQTRIVEKVDQLFALCDQLKAKLEAANTTQLQLTEAVVEHSLMRH